MSSEGDIVLVHVEDQPVIYGRIENIEPDIKKEWYRVTLLLLSIPPQVITWILREEYINGAPFTMDGKTIIMREIKRVNVPLNIDQTGPASGGAPVAGGKGKVLPFKVSPK